MYVKAKADPGWRFWGLYVHVCKRETLHAAYALARKNNGAPGIDGVTFEAIEASGVEAFLERIRAELVSGQYRPMRNRRREIPKDGGKVRVLGIPAIRDRVVQGALKFILEPIFEADFQPGSYGYRPKRTAHAAVYRVAEAVVLGKTRVLDVDLRSYLDPPSHYTSVCGWLAEEAGKRLGDLDRCTAMTTCSSSVRSNSLRSRSVVVGADQTFSRSVPSDKIALRSSALGARGRCCSRRANSACAAPRVRRCFSHSASRPRATSRLSGSTAR